MGDLIDTTEMYLRTVFELEEEGIVALRARIAERLEQSGPTVSQTVARMERDGLITVEGDRHLHLTPQGRGMAMRVMRKHRLAECLLVDIIGLPWEDVRSEACRWEHVMSESVERRILDLLKHPTHSPFGNPIPGLDELGDAGAPDDGALVGLDRVLEHPHHRHAAQEVPAEEARGQEQDDQAEQHEEAAGAALARRFERGRGGWRGRGHGGARRSAIEPRL